jgi:hypothetical protein
MGWWLWPIVLLAAPWLSALLASVLLSAVLRIKVRVGAIWPHCAALCLSPSHCASHYLLTVYLTVSLRLSLSPYESHPTVESAAESLCQVRVGAIWPHKISDAWGFAQITVLPTAAPTTLVPHCCTFHRVSAHCFTTTQPR